MVFLLWGCLPRLYPCRGFTLGPYTDTWSLRLTSIPLSASHQELKHAPNWLSRTSISIFTCFFIFQIIIGIGLGAAVCSWCSKPHGWAYEAGSKNGRIPCWSYDVKDDHCRGKVQMHRRNTLYCRHVIRKQCCFLSPKRQGRARRHC